MTDTLTVRFRVDFGAECSVGIGKIELLEAIQRTGSLSRAARLLKMSYRRAWLLMADLNSSFDRPVVDTMTGGVRGGGAALTAFGRELVAGYRELESSLQPMADRCLKELRKRVATGSVRRIARPRTARPGARRRVPAG